MGKEKGSCHCGRIQFTVELDPKKGLACNCSMCGRKGTLLSFVTSDKFTLNAGEGSMTDYQFGKKSIHHTFCSTCGVTAFASGKTPDGNSMIAVNIRCLESFDLEKTEIAHHDGKKA